MLKTKIFLFVTIPFLLMVLIGCERVYSDGETEEVGVMIAISDAIIGKPDRKKRDLKKLKALKGDPATIEKIKTENALITAENYKISKHNIGAQEDRKAPDSGLLPVLATLLTTVGLGAYAHLLERKKLHAARDKAEKLAKVAEDETQIVMAGYQEIKEGLRDDEGALEKAKGLFNTGMKIWNESEDNATIVLDNVEVFKDEYKKLRAVHRDVINK